jgi:aminopeptidase
MQPTPAMIRAAQQAMTHVLDLVPDDRVFVLTDGPTLSCGMAFIRAAEDLGCQVTHTVLPDSDQPLQEVPVELLARLENRTVVINALVGDAEWIPFRIQWITAIEQTERIRLGHSPGITIEMMNGGSMDVDYAAMQAGARVLDELLKDAVSLHITSELGTDITLDVTDRRWVNDLKATIEDGANLPCGETYCCPVETGADGVLVVDGCYGAAGKVPAPVTLHVEKGKVVKVECEHEDTRRDVEGLLATDANADIICELGIGLNPGARLTDRMLEAEKAFETAHIAFGGNQGMPGGQNTSSMHIDYLFTRPTIVATTRNGGQQVVLQDGKVPR